MPWRELDDALLIVVEDSLSEVLELCYIPVFGGGFGFDYDTAKTMPPLQRRKVLKWLGQKREAEVKAFKTGRTGGWSAGNADSGFRGPTTFSRLRKPRTPER